MNSAEHPDWALVTKLGGPARVSEILSFGAGGVQRVQNWKTRGIPPAMKLKRPDLFLPEFKAEWDGSERRTPAPCSSHR